MLQKRKIPSIILVLLVITLFVVSQYLYTIRLTSNLKVSLLDIGQGDAMYIEAPNGRQMMVDGGPRGVLKNILPTVMPYGDTSIDVLVITNPDVDHFAGYIDIVKKFDIGIVIEPGTLSPSKTYAEFESLIKQKHIPKIIARKGMTIDLDQDRGVRYTVLFPDQDVSNWKRNDGSLVGKLTYGTRSFMLTGDADFVTESVLFLHTKPEILQSDILKVGHHGSKTSTSNAFIEAVKPAIAIISAGENNRYGHPTTETLARLSTHQVETHVTKDEGTISYSTDGTILTRSR